MIMTASELATCTPHPTTVLLRSYKGRHPRVKAVLNSKDLNHALVRFECYGKKRKYIGKNQTSMKRLSSLKPINRRKANMPFVMNLDSFTIACRITQETADDPNGLESLPQRIQMYDVVSTIECITPRYTQKQISQMSRKYLKTTQDRCRQPKRTAEQLLRVWEADPEIKIFPEPVLSTNPQEHPKHGNRKRDCYHDLKAQMFAIKGNLRLWRGRQYFADKLGSKYNLAPNTVKNLFTEVRQDYPELLKISNRPYTIHRLVDGENVRKGKTHEFRKADLKKAFNLNEVEVITIMAGKKKRTYGK